MIRSIQVSLNAAHPELPLVEATGYVGAPSTAFIRGVPRAVGSWRITAVRVAVAYPDNSARTFAATISADGVWTATIAATATNGRVVNGFQVLADGIDETGAAVEGYVLGVADFAVYSRDMTIDAGGTSWYMHLFDTAPNPPRKGDVALVDGVLKYYDGTAWQPFGADANALVAKSALAPLSDQVLPEVATQRETNNMVRLILNTLKAAAVAVAVAFALPAPAVTPTTEWQDVPPTNIVADVVGEFAPTKADATLEYVTPPVPAHEPLVFTPSDEGDIFAGSVSTNAGALKLGSQEDKLLAPFGEYVRADVDPLKIGLAADAGGTGSAAIGVEASAASTNTIAIGTKAYANGTGAIAIGAGAKASANGAVQIGYSTTTNTTTNSLRFRDLTIVQNGKIPNSALAGSFVPTSRKVNGQTLAADVTITAASIGAATVADATLMALTGFSPWTIYREGVDVTAQVSDQPRYVRIGEDIYAWLIETVHIATDQVDQDLIGGPENATSLSWRARDGEFNAVSYTAVRKALSGYRLGPADGPNADKPLASASDLEALAARVPTSAADIGATTPANVTNIVQGMSLGGIWDNQLEVWWTPVMSGGNLTYQATTNANLNVGR